MRSAVRRHDVELPFTREQFFDAFAAYNRALWPFALGLWAFALAAAARLARAADGDSRFPASMLAVQWAWAALAYHAAFFSAINRAAWLFAALFVIQSGLVVWFGLVRGQLRFSRAGSPRRLVAWILIGSSLLYPILAQVEGHAYPASPTFGVPCPTTILTIGFLFAADPPWPRTLAVIPMLWAFIGGSASGLLGVRSDLLLVAAGLALVADLVPWRRVWTKDRPGQGMSNRGLRWRH
jgi:hypothetical protein